MRIFSVVILLIASLAMYACGSSVAQNEEKDSVVDEAPAIVKAEKSPDQRFIDCVASNDKFAIEEAQIVLTRSETPEARAVALKMVEAHKASTVQLVRTAAQVGMQIGALVPAPSKNKKRLDSLRSLNLEQFDARYAADQIDSHEKTLAELNRYATSGASPTLRTLAQQMIPMTADHIQLARKVADPADVKVELLKQQSAP